MNAKAAKSILLGASGVNERRATGTLVAIAERRKLCPYVVLGWKILLEENFSRGHHITIQENG